MKYAFPLIVCALLLFPLVGCQKGSSGASAKDPVALGKELVQTKGCTACHSLDGSKKVGPTFKGMFGKKETVITDGKEREITVDEAYIRTSIKEPNKDIVKGYVANSMVLTQKVSDKEIDAIIAYLKTLK